MIKVTRQGENFIPPGFLRELKLINPSLFPLWIPKTGRWTIVSFVPSHVSKRGYVEEYAVSKGDQYTPLDQRTLRNLRELFYYKEKLAYAEKMLEEMDESDRMLYESAYRKYRAMRKECMKKLQRFKTTKTFS